jgi:hypothetical protein
MPLAFVKDPKLVFLRLKAATELKSVLEVNIKSRFVVLIIGPISYSNQLYEVGRAMSTCLADDVRCYSHFNFQQLIFNYLNKHEICRFVENRFIWQNPKKKYYQLLSNLIGAP